MRKQILAWLLLTTGTLLFLGGAVGLCSLYVTSPDYEHTEGVIRKFQTKRIYRFRKVRYEHEMLIAYPTEKYGELLVSRNSYWPFWNEGDKLSLWYRMNHPRDIRLPESEGMLWGFLLISGVGCFYVGNVLRKESEVANCGDNT